MHRPLMLTLVIAALLVGCSHAAPPPRPTPAPDKPATPAKPRVPETLQAPDWVRQSRYTLVSARPTLEQRQPLLQMVEVSIPPALHSDVGEALRHVLQRSGFSLCPDVAPQALLFSRPLPAVHYQIGPMALIDALTILGGPAWELSVDPLNRSVCYALRSPSPAAPVGTLGLVP
ncbi:PilL N-terminal domain-containing protein (plasmid) [Pseudomonas sp. App30]|uniref:PFGI-1 class ICE element type IV pilus protein PilL2 n=1 Tax=Pseudomonas sp. App30 TaxID=3068990 RepID=UPI003A80C9E1